MAAFQEERKKRSKVRKSNEIIGDEEVKNAFERLKEYQRSKAAIDQKATANQEWWKMRHWAQIQKKDQSKEQDEKPVSAWLFNSIINKHADIMDNFPKPNILPREENDVADAEMLSKIVPVILDQNKYRRTYDKAAYDFISDGGCITGVFWDNSKNDGMGDISIRQVDIHNIFWKPGISDIQDSPEVFTIAAVDNDALTAQYPQMDGHVGNDITKVEYLHDDHIDTTKQSYVVDWYYKVTKHEKVIEDPESGQWLTRERTVLHYCKFCNEVLLYASENDPNMSEGFYHHGKFPFVFRVMFPVKDTPWGFGYIDVMKSPQTYIDALDQIITKNAFMTGSPRFWARESAGVNIDEFADWSNPFVKFSSGNIEEVIRKIDVPTIPAFVVNHKTNKIEELKETSGNRDFSQGSTQSGVTAASAIAALQEAGSKLARDMIRVGYDGYEDEVYFVIELIRQFYTEPRSFRIDDGSGGYEFEQYSNKNINGVSMDEQGNELRRRPVFDIKVVAEKQSPFSRAAQNETMKELYGMGLFAPNNAEPALVCLDGMEFEGKESIKQQVQNNSMLMKQFQMMQQGIMQAETMYPGLGIAQMAGLAPAPVPELGAAPRKNGTAEERAARKDTDSTLAAKARVRAAKQAEV